MNKHPDPWSDSNITITQCAERIGLSRTVVSKWIKDRHPDLPPVDFSDPETMNRVTPQMQIDIQVYYGTRDTKRTITVESIAADLDMGFRTLTRYINQGLTHQGAIVVSPRRRRMYTPEEAKIVKSDVKRIRSEREVKRGL